ncbi:hypothetical protein NDU88_012419 [Pleurodeles waltl]|uniref:Uncharacterized protein n=1 Tax=Pleurodeles waltl TaxID=8319 RepID=A0AAV7R2S0_PLEWA|nr:hypothetical protein NDU88_012419 [Pleurodeles waltl]
MRNSHPRLHLIICWGHNTTTGDDRGNLGAHPSRIRSLHRATHQHRAVARMTFSNSAILRTHPDRAEDTGAMSGVHLGHVQLPHDDTGVSRHEIPISAVRHREPTPVASIHSVPPVAF